MERLDGTGGFAERCEQGRLEAAGRRGDLRGRHLQGVEVGPVEAGRVVPEGGVPPHADVVDYGAYLRHRALAHEVGPWEGAPEVRSAAAKVEALEHGCSVSVRLGRIRRSGAEMGDDGA